MTDPESPQGITEKTAFQVKGAAMATGYSATYNEDLGTVELQRMGTHSMGTFLTTEQQARAWLSGVSIACRGRS